MGDSKRFRKFAELISYHFPNREQRIADVASGNGSLQQELRQRSFINIISWDKRRRNAKGRPGYRYKLFNWRCDEKYDLVIGMHPDEATDHIIMYAVRNNIPFVVCPCCIKPSAYIYNDKSNFELWVEHLKRLARGFIITEHYLRIDGKNLVLIGKPRRK